MWRAGAFGYEAEGETGEMRIPFRRATV
jgi:hypothetical protein